MSDLDVPGDLRVAIDLGSPDLLPPPDLALPPPQSCLDVQTRDPNLGSGLYAIDPDGAGPIAPLTVSCDLQIDGGGFTLIYDQDLTRSAYPTALNQLLLQSPGDPTAGLYSILQYLPAFARDGTYTFRIDWPGHSKRNIWSQTTNPTDDVNVAGYTAIDVQATANLWGGLELGNGTHGPQNNNAALIDGSVNSATWYYAIGTQIPWGNPNGIPASDDVAGANAGVNRVRLWVR